MVLRWTSSVLIHIIFLLGSLSYAQSTTTTSVPSFATTTTPPIATTSSSKVPAGPVSQTSSSTSSQSTSASHNGDAAAFVHYNPIIIVVVIVAAAAILWFVAARRRRRKSARNATRHSALTQDLGDWPNQRRWLHAGHWREEYRVFRGYNQPEGLNERGEAPPPYKHADEAQPEYVIGGDQAQGSAVPYTPDVPLATFSRPLQGIRPPEYNDSMSSLDHTHVARPISPGPPSSRLGSGPPQPYLH